MAFVEQSENVIVRLTFEFSLSIIKFTELLENNKKWVIAKQLLRCGTSIGANVWEAQSAESRHDFIHKIKISAKEAYETQYWLLLCQKSENYPECNELIEKLENIKRILGKIISTSRENIEKR